MRIHGQTFILAFPPIPADIHVQTDEEYRPAVGSTMGGRPEFAAFTFRVKGGRSFVRPVSARYMHRKEVERYEEESSQAES